MGGVAFYNGCLTTPPDNKQTGTPPTNPAAKPPSQASGAPGAAPSRTVFTRGKYAPPMSAPHYNRPVSQSRFSGANAAQASKPVLVRPKKVRNGVKISVTVEGEVAPASAWAAQRWLRLIEQAGEGNALIEGLEYAREGQTKKYTILGAVGPGRVEAIIQGRADRPYTTTLTLETISHEDWERAVHAMSDGVMYAAKLLSAELPPSIEDVFVPLGLKLFPASPADIHVACSCTDFERKVREAREREAEGSQAGKPAAVWCKHLCCAAYILVNRIASEPFLVFGLRGMDTHDLLDRLRQRRQVVGAAMGATPIYPARVPGVSDVDSPALDANLAAFWQLGAQARELDLSPQPPQVSHPLLRRLGQSPWTGTGAANFPLVGLLASCYDAISQRALKEDTEPAPASDTAH